MSEPTFDDPNREAVGQPPIWTGADDGGSPPPEQQQYKEAEVTPVEVPES